MHKPRKCSLELLILLQRTPFWPFWVASVLCHPSAWEITEVVFQDL